MKSSIRREELLEARVRDLEERLRLSQKLGSIVHLAAGMGEELNHTLAMMMMCASLAKEGGDGVDQQELLGDLEKGCNRLTVLTRQLLAFHRRSMINLRPLNLGGVVADQARTLKPLLGERIEWQLLLPEGLPMVEADKALIKQVLLNLCLNARDAMQQGGTIQLELSQEEVNEERAKTKPGARPGRFVRLSVRDTGCGMEEHLLERLWGPFFTANGVGRETSLGLATVRGIVHRHHGWVEVQSQLGKGSTFSIYLPALAPATETTAHPTPMADKFPSGKGTILSVGHGGIRECTNMLLMLQGYTVLDTEEGDTAAQCWADHRESVDLLFTDMAIRGECSGLQLSERFRAEKPDLKVVIANCSETDIAGLEAAMKTGIVCILKPVPPDALSVVTQQCLQAIERCLQNKLATSEWRAGSVVETTGLKDQPGD